MSEFVKENNDELIEDSEYSKKSEFSKAVLVSEQVQRCLTLRSKDMKPGYTTYFLDGTGQAHPKIIPDSRKEFVSAAEALKNMLSPEIKSKNPEIEKDYQKAKKRAFDKYAYKERLHKFFPNGDSANPVQWKLSGRVYMPQKGQPVLIDDPKAPKSCSVSKDCNAWNSRIDAYWDELVEAADKLFQELNELIHNLDYFKGGSSF